MRDNPAGPQAAEALSSVKSALKDAYGIAGGYYKEFEKLNKGLFSGSAGANGLDGLAGLASGPLGLGDMETAAKVLSQMMLSTLKAANWAARSVAGASMPADKSSPVKEKENIGFVFHAGRYRVRVFMEPAVIPADLQPYVWPLRNPGSKSGVELTSEHVRLEAEEGRTLLTLSELPDDLDPGTYYGPITSGAENPTDVLGSVFLSVNTPGVQPPTGRGRNRKAKPKKR